MFNAISQKYTILKETLKLGQFAYKAEFFFVHVILQINVWLKSKQIEEDVIKIKNDIDEIKNILMSFDENCKNINFKKGIYLYGSPGSGKTYFSNNYILIHRFSHIFCFQYRTETSFCKAVRKPSVLVVYKS